MKFDNARILFEARPSLAFHRAALPNVFIYPHKAGLPHPLKSPRHRSLSLLEASLWIFDEFLRSES